MFDQDDRTQLRADQYGLRRQMVDALRDDLVGPNGGPTEIIDDAPTTRYVSGMLFPVPLVESVDQPDPEDKDQLEDGEEGSAPDPGIARLAARMPSTCGLTFAVQLSTTDRIILEPSAARYTPCDEEGRAKDGYDRTDFELLEGKWLRAQTPIDNVDVDVTAPGDHRFALADCLDLFVRVRDPDDRGIVSITASLINTAIPSAGIRDLDTYLQVGLSAHGPGQIPCFAERRYGSAAVDDDEIESYELLYRHARSFAVGHGCAAIWTVPDDSEHADSITLAFVPEVPVNVSDSNDGIKSAALSMRFCAEASIADLAASLRVLVDGYDKWISAIDAEGRGLGERYAAAVNRHLAECRRASRRLSEGIALLESDADSLRAFRLANEAMRLQRTRTDWMRAGRTTSHPDDEGDGLWRPFQLAFILMCLPGIADPASDDREIVDLLWFPTGGGKTEAYLGLIAFTIFRRRIVRSDGAGVTVLMRYTLRLLTLQQFSRAALLITCCEFLRSQHSGLGDERISIGLWVGRGATPNSRAEAVKALAEIRAGAIPEEGDPRQLQHCVWCGTRLRTDHYWPAQNPQRIAVSCRNRAGCHFAAGLPVYLVDEDLYDYRPSLVIATVDKFASLPWNPRVAALFGIDHATPPPELIVQDELHLISGPLGTLAGLYETAVDALCEDSGCRPKVIASTATIRRATAQVAALFDRRMDQFPPPGIDARNSYFAKEAPPEKRGNRVYAGVMAPATSQTTAMVRTYARLLASSEVAEVDDRVKDPYWTLLGYFNSLRVLGGARMQVQDDVQDRLKLLLGRESDRSLEPIEMTSRVASADIPEHLVQMETDLSAGAANVLDVVLATNMISVGVDIDRLGLMVVMGQPQATAEYIQATSRVGRQHPGLVVTVFNPARSRDRSHYESFQTYHGALYRQVESTSVTPFASRSRDRGLHAVFIALCRILVSGLRDNGAAADIGQHLPETNALTDKIIARVRRTDPEAVDETRRELARLIDLWLARAAHVPKLKYSNPYAVHEALLADPAKAHDIGVLATLYSLRDVDLESSLQVIG